MNESLMDYEPLRRIMIDEIPFSIMHYAIHIKWLTSKDINCIRYLNSDYYHINSIEDVKIDPEFVDNFSKEEIEKSRLCLFKLVDLTRNKIITSDYYKTHVHRGTPSDCERLFSVYHDELKEILEIIKS